MAFPQAPQTNPHTEPSSRRDSNRLAVTVRVPKPMLTKIDTEARRLGLSRAAFMLANVIRQLDRTDG